MNKASEKNSSPPPSSRESSSLELNLANFLVHLAGFAIGICSLTFVLTWTFFASSTPTESTDKLLALATGLSALAVGLIALAKKLKLEQSFFFSGIGIVTTSVGLFIVENKLMSKEHPMGFGPFVFFLAIFITFFLIEILEKTIENGSFRFLWIPYSFFISGSVLLAFIQTNGTLLEAGHSEYVVNEIMSVSEGYIPFQDFIPQYSYLYAFIAAPLISKLSPEVALNLIITSLSIISIVVLVLVVWFGKKAFSKAPIFLLVALMIPFTTITPGWNRAEFWGPASTLLSGPPIRVFSGFIIGLITYFLLMALIKGKSAIGLSIAHGVIVALFGLNNFDYAIAGVVASYLVLGIFILNRKNGTAKYLFLSLGFFVISLVALFSWLILIGKAPEISKFAWFSRQFGGGFAGVPISVPGPVLFVLPTMFGLTTMVVYSFIIRSRINKMDDLNRFSSSAIGAYFGIWAILCLPYYLNRSFHSGQMTMEYFAFSILIISSLGLLYESLRKKSSRFRIPDFHFKLIVSTLLATVLLIPNFTMEIDRLSGENSNGRIPRASLQPVVSYVGEAQKYAESKMLSIGYFGESGFYVQKKFGIKSINLFNIPLDMFQSNNSVREGCLYLEERGTEVLLASELGKQAFAWPDGTLCEGLYKIVITRSGVYLAERQIRT
jgi:hypothetical protein